MNGKMYCGVFVVCFVSFLCASNKQSSIGFSDSTVSWPSVSELTKNIEGRLAIKSTDSNTVRENRGRSLGLSEKSSNSSEKVDTQEGSRQLLSLDACAQTPKGKPSNFLSCYFCCADCSDDTGGI